MENYKSRTKLLFHFSNPLDDVSWTETEEDYEDRRDDDDDGGGYDHQSKNSGFLYSLPPNIQNSRSLGRMDTSKVSHKKPSTLNNGELLSNIDRTMTELSVNHLHAIDGLSARISELHGKTLQLEYHYRIVYGKLNQLQDILQETVNEKNLKLFQAEFIYSLRLKLSENLKSMDLNVVLDKVINRYLKMQNDNN